jgi:hypothetical protein
LSVASSRLRITDVFGIAVSFVVLGQFDETNSAEGVLEMHSMPRISFRLIFLSLPIVVFGVQLSSQEPQLVPPSQSVMPAIVTADSGMKSSGIGKNWSHWYTLGTGKAPRGYTVWRTEFWLTGDRSCGDSAECREVERSDERVLWQFRLQGNATDDLAKVASAEAHIRVTYRPR